MFIENNNRFEYQQDQLVNFLFLTLCIYLFFDRISEYKHAVLPYLSFT